MPANGPHTLIVAGQKFQYPPNVPPIAIQDDHGVFAALPELVTVKLTDAQIKALFTHPVEVVPSPGPGLFLLPISYVASVDTRHGSYVLPGSITLHYADGTGVYTPNDSLFTDPPGLQVVAATAEPGGGNFFPPADNAIVLSAATGDPTGGGAGNSLSLVFTFQVAPAIPFGT